MLSRDSSSFSTLFTLPQGGHAPEGSSDERPIYLRGDNANQFRNFLWAMYALYVCQLATYLLRVTHNSSG